MSKLFRIKDPVVLTDPTSGVMVTPTPAEKYPADHVLVRAYPWAFESDEDTANVEQATAAPGERRTTTSKRR